MRRIYEPVLFYIQSPEFVTSAFIVYLGRRVTLTTSALSGALVFSSTITRKKEAELACKGNRLQNSLTLAKIKHNFAKKNGGETTICIVVNFQPLSKRRGGGRGKRDIIDHSENIK